MTHSQNNPRTVARQYVCRLCGDTYTANVSVIDVGRHTITFPVVPQPCPKPDCRQQADSNREELNAMNAQAPLKVKPPTVRDVVAESTPPRHHDALDAPLHPKLVSLGYTQSLLLTGSTGSGKTFAAVTWAMQWSVHRHDAHQANGVQFVTAPDLMQRIRESFGEQPLTLPNNALLILDDLGAEKPSEWVEEQLTRLIDERYREYAPTVITSNLGLSDIAGRVGDRIASRLAEMCRIVKIEGKDRRIGM